MPLNPRRVWRYCGGCTGREILRIGAAEILGTKPVAEIGRELADLADVVVELALEICEHALWQEHGHPLDERGRPSALSRRRLGQIRRAGVKLQLGHRT